MTNRALGAEIESPTSPTSTSDLHGEIVSGLDHHRSGGRTGPVPAGQVGTNMPLRLPGCQGRLKSGPLPTVEKWATSAALPVENAPPLTRSLSRWLGQAISPTSALARAPRSLSRSR